jgi:hypothetical protein
MNQPEEKKCALGSMFDWSFTCFITPKIIRLVYLLAIVGLAIVSVVMIVKAFGVSQGQGVVTLIVFAPLYFVIMVILTRIWLELIMIIFRIGEDVAKLAGRDICAGKPEMPTPAQEPGPEAGD